MLRAIFAATLVLCALAASAAGAAPPPGSENDRNSARAEPPAQTRFALTLATSTDPIADLVRYQRELPDWVVYQTQTMVAGSTVYVVRLGFFTDVTQAYALRRRLRSRYPDTWTAAVSAQEYEAAVASQKRPAGPPDTQALAAEAAALPFPETAADQPVAARANILSIELRSQSKPPAVHADDLPARYRGYHLYVTSEPDAAIARFHLRLGYFANRREAEIARQELARTFPGARIVEVSAHESVATKPAAPPAKAAHLPGAAVVAATNTAAAPTAEAGGAPASTTAATAAGAATVATGTAAAVVTGTAAVLSAAGSAAAATTATELGGDARASAPPSPAASQATLPAPATAPAAATADSVAPAASTAATPTQTVTAAQAQTSTAAGPPADEPAPIPPPTRATGPAIQPADPATEAQAAELLARAREALTAGDNTAAIEALDRLLRLPPNTASQEAQELAGVARERHGETVQARREYELYLKLYPEGEGADRVRQRLAALSTAPAFASAKRDAKPQPTQTLIFGGLSQYYYYGASKIESQPFDINANPLDPTTLSQTDQSAIITSLDYTMRWRSERYDNRLVFRDTYTANFTEIDDTNRLNAAYYDLKDKRLDYGARLGRQPGNTAGILLPFDGARVNYGFASQWRGNLQAGKLVDYYSHYDKQFGGASLDMGTFAERWNATAYVIQQQVDGISDREAIGTELRYFDPLRSFFALLDYDTSYSVVNTALFQGTWQLPGGTTYNLLLDRRKSPPMQTTNALIGETVTSIGELLNTLSEEEIRRYAKARTATASTYQISAAYPVNTIWQIGGDVQLSNISGTETIGTVEGAVGTDDQYIYGLQATGTQIFTKRDSLTVRASYIDAKTFDGQALSVFLRTLFAERWAYDLTLAYYTQTDDMGVDLARLAPTIKFGYTWKPNLLFELELGAERTTTSGPAGEEDTTRRFGSIGYRWDF